MISYMMVDLGSPRSIRLVKVIGRQDSTLANINSTNGFTVWVSDDLNFLTYGRQCDPSRYNPLNGLVPGLTQQFPCLMIGGGPDSFLSGRYVFIRRRTPLPNTVFEIGEFEVYGVAAMRTVTINRPCVLSSEPADGSGRCGLALDGNLNTFASNNNDAENFYPNSTSSMVTGGPSRGFAWITVDLGISTVISSLTLYARQDENGATFPFENQLLMSNFSVWVGDLPSWFNSNLNVRNAPCNQTFLPKTLAGLPNNSSSIQCINLDGISHVRSPMVPMTGRFLTIQAQPGQTKFQIAEIDVKTDMILVSQFKPCTQSSVYLTRKCDQAFDGDVTLQPSAHTNADTDNHFTVDLGISTAVRLIKITNRKDASNFGRMNNMELYVGDNPRWSLNTLCDPSLVSNQWTVPLGQATAWALTNPCILTGRYVSIHVPGGNTATGLGVNNINILEFQVYAANACPNRYATGATQLTGSTCSGAGYGAICTFVCNTGWVAKRGAASSACNGEEWDAPELVCAPPCPQLLPPQYVETCSQSYFSETFNIDGALIRFTSLNPSTEKLAIPSSAPPQQSKWFQLDGMLQANSILSCASDMHLKIASPIISTLPDDFTLSASISTNTRAGLIFRSQDDGNMMRFWFDVQRKSSKLERIENGYMTTISESSSYLFTPGFFHTVEITMVGPKITITFDGIVVISSIDGTFIIGNAGVYAQSVALFDDIVFSSSCTSCNSLTDGDVCTFGCGEGLISVGPVSRTCKGTSSIQSMSYDPLPSVFPLVCTLAAPTFQPSTLRVLENSIKNSNVGDPLVASSSSPDFQIQFVIDAVYAMQEYLNPTFVPYRIQSQSLFWVDACSGQVKLRTGGKDVMNFEGINRYIITARAFIAGFAGAESVLNVTVTVLNLDEPPVVQTSLVYMKENAALPPGQGAVPEIWKSIEGVLVGTPIVWDPENSTLMYKLAVDGSSGRFTLDNVTSKVYTVQGEMALFNFEALPNIYTLSVTAYQKNDSMMTSTNSFIIQLEDDNDPPLAEDEQILSIYESADATIPIYTGPSTISAGSVIAFDEDTNTTFNNGTILFSLISSGCGSGASSVSAARAAQGASFFSIDALTGKVYLSTNDSPRWPVRAAFLSGGQLLRATYSICVKIVDVVGASEVEPVTINVIADPSSQPVISSSSLTEEMPTVGLTTVTFTGSGFPTSGETLQAYYTNGVLLYNATACTIISSSSCSCKTQPGFSNSFRWYLQLSSGKDVLPLIPLSMSYADPTVTSVSATATNMATVGGAQITISGTNFGPNPLTEPSYGYPYSNPSIIVGKNKEFRCAVKSYTHTSIICAMPAGIGASLPWKLSVGANDFEGLPAVYPFSYAEPIISNVTGSTAAVDVTKLDTFGGEYITITGSNFGPSTIV